MSSPGPQRRAPRGAVGGRCCPNCGTVLAADNTARLCSRCHREQRDQLRTPPEFGDGFFETDEFRAAFASQHIGKVFKAYRNHLRHLQLLGKALNQELLGRWLGLTQAQVSKIENGKPEQNLETLRGYAKILRLPQHLLWFDLPGQSRLNPPQSSRGISKFITLTSQELDDTIVVPARTADGEVIFVSVSRRLFLQGVGSAAVGAVTNTGLVLPESGATSEVLDLGVSPVEHFQRMRDILIDSDNMFGPCQVISTVRAQVDVMQRLRQRARGADQRELARMQSQYAEFCSWLYQDAGDHHAAQYWIDRALEWSHVAGDHDLTVFILARKAQLAGDMRQGNEAVGVAEAALSMAPVGSLLAAVAATYAAHGYSLAGDREETMRAYDRARSLLHAVEPANPATWGEWLDESYIAVHQAHSLTVLGDHSAAIDVFQIAIDALPRSYTRDRGVYLARSAVANAGGRQAECAAELGLRALAIGAETGSDRIMKELVHLRDILPKSSIAIEVSTFLTAMDDMLARQG